MPIFNTVFFLTVAILFLDAIKYSILSKVLDFDLRHIYLVFLAPFIISICCALFPLPFTYYHLSNVVFIYVALLCLYDVVSFRSRLAQLLTVLLFSEAITELTENLLRLVFSLPDLTRMLVADMIAVFLICIYNLFLKNKDAKTKQDIMSKNSYPFHIVLVFIGILILLLIAALSTTRNYIQSTHFQTLVTFLSILGYVGVIILEYTLLYLSKINSLLQTMLRAENDLQKAQYTMYQLRLEREESTRRYRHDMKNHLAILKNYIDAENPMAASQYLESLEASLTGTKESAPSSGNEIIDALTSYYMQDLSDANIEFKMQGTFSSEFPISDIKLSSLYGNLLENAMEEQKRIPPTENRFIHIHFSSGKHTISFKIENASRGLSSLQTHKKEKELHGIGLHNAKQIAKEAGGELNNRSGNPFIVEVILPI